MIETIHRPEHRIVRINARAGALVGYPQESLIGSAIERLLAFSRRQPLRSVAVRPNLLIDGIMKLLTRMLGEDIEITLDLAADPWLVMTDPAQPDLIPL